MKQRRGRPAAGNASAYMLANFHHMFAFEDWWEASKDSFDWKPVEPLPKQLSTIDTLARGVLLRDGNIWMLGCWDCGGWSRLTGRASWPIGNWHPTQWATPGLETLVMLMAE